MKGEVLQFRITTHKHLDGARLSLLGHWGNIPYPADEAAADAARSFAAGRNSGAGQAYVIDRESH